MTDHRNLFELEEVTRQLFRKFSAGWSKFDETGMTPSQGFLLDRLDSEGRLKVSQIADMLGYTPGAITALADKLAASGYVERERTEEDRRIVYLDITPEGINMLGKIRELRKANVQTFFGDLADEDIAHLIRIFNEIVTKEEKKK